MEYDSVYTVLALGPEWEIKEVYPVTSLAGNNTVRVTGIAHGSHFGLEFRLHDAGAEVVRALRIAPTTN